MNGRAALVDSWRAIQISADALQSVLNVTVDGDVRTTRNNAAAFNGTTRSLRVGVEFDAPFTRLLERNNYRQTLIEYHVKTTRGENHYKIRIDPNGRVLARYREVPAELEIEVRLQAG